MDHKTTISQLKKDIIQFRDEREWAQFHHPKNLSMSIGIEAGELMELFQWMETRDVSDIKKDSKLMTSVSEEIADVLIYCLSMSDMLDLDITSSILSKLEQNREKYPIEKSRGSSKKYTEL